MNPKFIFERFPEFTETQKKQIIALYPLYYDWNEKINVVSRKDIDNLFLHHILHSLSILKYVKFERLSTVIDVGTGGGFPGIPLAIALPEVRFTLCDSIAKKIKVVSAISTELSLTNIVPFCGRAESIPNKYDYVVSRAVTNLSDFIPLVDKLYTKGIIALKGGDTESEIDQCVEKLKIKRERFESVNISNWFEEDFFIEKKIVFIKR